MTGGRRVAQAIVRTGSVPLDVLPPLVIASANAALAHRSSRGEWEVEARGLTSR